MTEEPQPKPIRVEFTGMQPTAGKQWCACCALRYMGAFSTDPTIRAHAREIVEDAIARGNEYVNISLPSKVTLDGYPTFIVRYAITEAPSVYYPEIPMPVCWVHIQGMHPEGRHDQPRNIPTSLIPGKKYEVPKGALPDE